MVRKINSHRGSRVKREPMSIEFFSVVLIYFSQNLCCQFFLKEYFVQKVSIDFMEKNFSCTWKNFCGSFFHFN
jgi:hypothetical protein